MNFVYDHSVNGLFCLLAKTIKEHLEISSISRHHQQQSGFLFADYCLISSDRRRAAEVAAGLERKLGKQFVQRLLWAFFSDLDRIEQDLIEMTRRCLLHDPDYWQQLTEPLVLRVDAAALKTSRERHKLLGLLRFSRLEDDSYVAFATPKANIIPLLGSHFIRRLGDQKWLIVDRKRKTAVYRTESGWELASQVALADHHRLHQDEQEVVKLWKNFYQEISNPDRFNPKLRQSFMPKRYWNDLVELHPDYPRQHPPAKAH